MAVAVNVAAFGKVDGLSRAYGDNRSFVVGVRHSAAHILDNHGVAQFPLRLEPSLGLIGSSPGSQRPHYFLLLVPVRGHHHFEQESLAARIEMRRLALVAKHLGSHGDGVFGAEWDVDLFLVVPVEVAEDQAVGAVGVVLPSFKYGGDVLAPCILDLRT